MIARDEDREVSPMRSLWLCAAAAASLSLAAGSALGADFEPQAEPTVEAGWYAGVFGGASWPRDMDFEDEFKLELDRGFTAGAVVGSHFFDYLRAEVEASYARYDIDECSTGTVKCAVSDGDVSAFYLLGNLWFDFNLGGFSPYIGGGIGGARVDVDTSTFPDDSDWGFAFQAGAGVRFDLTDALQVDVGYRFKDVPDLSIDSLDTDLQTHNAQIGLTFGF
jgi:opacity protein-like surface antigen